MPPAIELRCATMHLADPDARSTANDADPQPTAEPLSQLFVVHRCPVEVIRCHGPIFAEPLDIAGQIPCVAWPVLVLRQRRSGSEGDCNAVIRWGARTCPHRKRLDGRAGLGV